MVLTLTPIGYFFASLALPAHAGHIGTSSSISSEQLLHTRVPQTMQFVMYSPVFSTPQT
jgi:hypothetical protein